MTVVLGIGLLYGVLIMTTFQRYGTVMDKKWKERIDDWIAGKAIVNKDSLAQPGPDDLPPYPPPPQWYPDRSGMYQPFIPPPLQNQPSSGDFTGYPWYTPNTYVPAPHTGPPHSSTPHESDPSTVYRLEPNQPPVNTFPDRSSDFQDYGRMTSAPYIPNPGVAFPNPNPWGSVSTAREYQFPPGFVSQSSLSPVPESPITPREDRDGALGFTSGFSTDDAPQDGHRVRFRLPTGNSGSPNQEFPREPYPRKPPPKKTAMKKV